MNRCQAVYFLAPRQIEVREEPIPDLQPGRVLVQTHISAISPGTEMLVYRGQFPGGMATDAGISTLASEFSYPLKYGYSVVGQVVKAGRGVDRSWEGQRVFAFQPHQSHFQADPVELIPVPEGLAVDEAVFLPNMETAVNFVMDGKPLIGERVLVLGQGIVGLLTAALLVRFPLRCLVTVDRYSTRRSTSLLFGPDASLDPESPGFSAQTHELLPEGADLAYELTGSPAALDTAIALTGFEGRVVIGSWYGQKRANLDLGGRFHRSRIRLISSQVSTLAAELTGRWSKQRRFEVAWEMVRSIQPAKLITQRFPIQEAGRAYALIDENPEKTIQVVLTYD
jgi:2-desacetyl-2-hydroxyethyl bacteriochlorophyllide A dehydrogenase